MSYYYDPDGGQFPKPPQGTWRFRISRKPEPDKTKNGKDYLHFFFDLLFPDGNEQEYRENFFPWREEWRDLLIALGGTVDEKGRVHIGKEESVIDKVIQADIVYETPTGSDKSFARMKNIVPCPKEPFEDKEEEETEDEEVPF